MFAVVNLAQLVIIFDWMIYASVVPSVMQDLHLSYWEAGLPITVLLAVMALMQFVGGSLADRYSEFLLSLVAMGAAVLGSAAAALAGSLTALILSRALNGVGSGLSFIAGMRMASRLYRGRSVALAMGVFGSMVNLGILLSAVAAVPLAGRFGWRGLFWVAAAGSLMIMALYPLVDRTALRPRPRGSDAAVRPGSMLGELHRFLHPVTWIVGLAHCASFGLLLAMTNWFPTLLTGGAGLSPGYVSRIMGLFAAVGVAGRMSGGVIADRMGRRLHTALTQGLLGLVIAGFALPAQPAHPLRVTLLVLAVGWLANHPFSTLMSGAAASDPEHAGAVLGTLNMVALGVAMTLPVIFGWLIDQTHSFGAGLWFFAAAAWAGMLLSRFLPVWKTHAPHRGNGVET